MPTSRDQFKDFPVATRRQAVDTRLSQAQNALYNIHLSEVEGLQVNEPEKERLTKAVEALTAIQSELIAEAEAEAAKEKETP